MRTTIAAVAVLVAMCSIASAATFSVDSPLDEADALAGDGACQTMSGTCTLRAAVQEANAFVGADTIEVPAGTYVLMSGVLSVTQALTVEGAGAATTMLDGNNSSGVFSASAPLTVSGVTIRNGRGISLGGGIYASTLVMRDCIVTGNSTQVLGGGIYSNDLTLERTTVEGNTAGALGGGIAAVAGSIRDSTITGNTTNGVLGVGGGDAVTVSGGVPFTVANSTIAHEFTNFSFCMGPLDPCGEGDEVTLSNVTVEAVRNRTVQGFSTGTFTLRNTIVSSACGAFVISQGYNIIADASSCTITGDTTGNQIGVDPLLGPLADNGGPTQTRRPGVPAIEAGNPAPPGGGGAACEATDQRGVARPIGLRCDVGAVEADCGDGVPQPGEECDDGNATNGDGCDDNCRVTACGNGIVTAGEACDDGNLVPGDCCSPVCQFEAAGSSCASDGDDCTDDVCDGGGACAHTPSSGGSCDDGNPCTTGDQCAAGTCVPGTPCSPCLECNPFLGCRVPFDSGCAAVATPRGSRLTLKNGPTDTLSWRWKSADPIVSFPNTSATVLCIYDANGLVLDATAASTDCAPDSCWSTRSSGFVYRNKIRLPDGLGSVALKKGNGKRGARIRVQGKGVALGLGAGPLVTPVRVRLFDSPACYKADFAAGVAVNTAAKFTAKSD